MKYPVTSAISNYCIHEFSNHRELYDSIILEKNIK